MRILSTLRLRSGQVWLIVLLSGCALLPPAPAPAPRPAQPETLPFAMNGRISITHRDKRDSAGLRWIHQVQADEILLLAPLGQTAARVYSDTRRDARQATLDSDGKHYQADDVESLMEQALGWHLPLKGLHHWVLGMADPDSPAQTERGDTGRITVLHQDGWEVRYPGYADDTTDALPKRMLLNYEDLQVTLLIDEWEWDPK